MPSPDQLELIFTRSTINRGEDVDLARRIVGQARRLPSLDEMASEALALQNRAFELLRIHGAARIANEVRLEWNPRLKSCAGRADYRHKLISLNPRLWDVCHEPNYSNAAQPKLVRLNRTSLNSESGRSSEESCTQKIVYNEIERTFLHELAHLLAQFRGGRKRVPPHGSEWREACRDLGIAGEKRCHNLPFPIRERVRRFLYKCPNCARDFPRVRKIRRAIACLACCRAHNDGEFDGRFRLNLISSCGQSHRRPMM